MANTSKRGFASMEGEKQRLIASKGGKAAHAKGTAHEWSSDEARAAGRKGGESRGSRSTPHSTQMIASGVVASPLADHALATNFLANAGRSLRADAYRPEGTSGNPLATPPARIDPNVNYPTYNTAVAETHYAAE